MPTNNIDLRFTVINAARVVIQRTAEQAELFRLTQPPMRRRYVENEAICGNCNGQGLQGPDDYCRVCRGYGIMPWYEFVQGYAYDQILAGVLYTQYVHELKSKPIW